MARQRLAIGLIAALCLHACIVTRPPVSERPAGPTAAPSVESRFQAQMRAAEAQLQAGHANEAWQLISTLAEPAAAGAGVPYERLRERIALADGRPLEAIRSEQAAEGWLSSDAERVTWRGDLLAGLRDAHARGVPLDVEAGKDATARGWLELASLPLAPAPGGTRAPSVADLARWRGRYPGHPAQVLLHAAPGLRPPAAAEPRSAPPPSVPAAGAHIALLLPLSGPAATQAATTRDGFLAAVELLPESQRPQVDVLDTAGLGVTEALGQARGNGAQLVVGPLTREEVAAVAAAGTQPMPVLALNFLPADQPSVSGLYQFALSPEDEARQVARKVVADGHRLGVVFLPRSDWGSRVASAFARELTLAGGTVTAQQIYDPTSKSLAAEIRSVLHIDDSDTRAKRLQAALGTPLTYEPRHRGDAEFVLIVPANTAAVHLIESQLKYFYAADIPTYSISSGYDPASADGNRDLEGLRFPEMPWLLHGDGTIDDLRALIEQRWEGHTAWRSRLFAFGYDAYELGAEILQHHLSAGAGQIPGLTGQLHFDADRRIQRDLVWVRVNKDGTPVRSDSAD